MKQKFYWTKEKEELLRQVWNTKSLYIIASEFHTTEETISDKARELGLEEYKSNRWTKEDEQLLLEYSKKYVTKTIAKKLGRSVVAVQKKAIKLGIELHSTPDPWKKWMVDYLKDNINKRPISQIEQVIGLSYHTILKKCKELRIEYRKESWTEEEIEILREYADKCHYTELTKVLPNRSTGAITAKAYELGIPIISTYTKLTDEQIQYIRENWGKMKATEIARNLKISIGVLNRYKKELKLPSLGQQKKWTEEVIEKIRKDAETKTRNELAKKYKTSPAQISTIAYKHHILLIDEKRIWTEELVLELKQLASKNTDISTIAQKLNLKVSTVRNKMKELGLSFRTKWTKEETEQLIFLAPTKSTEEIAVIVEKTEQQVYNKAVRLGIKVTRNKRNLWTEEDTKLLIKLQKHYELHLISKMMGKSEAIIRKKAKALGLKLTLKPKTRWTKEEEKMLLEYAKEYTEKEIALLLDRSVSSVHAKLAYMGIKAVESSKFWTEQEEKLKELAPLLTAKEIALQMDKTETAIKMKLQQLGIKAKITVKRWTKEEEEVLLELLTSYSSFEVAQILCRSEESLLEKAKELGYHITLKNRRWTKEEETILSDLWGSKPISQIAEQLNRTISALTNKAHSLGLGSQIENNYDGLRISEISNIFQVNRNVILTSWVALGLKLDFRKRSNYSVYAYVQIENLYEFLKANQNIWDSRILEKNIFGIEPDWLKEKRKRDLLSTENFDIESLSKQQLLLAKQYFLNLEQSKDDTEPSGPRLVKTDKKG